MIFARPAASYSRSRHNENSKGGGAVHLTILPPPSLPPHFTHLSVFDCHSVIGMPKCSKVPPGLSHAKKKSSELRVDCEAVTATVRVLLTIVTRAFSSRNALESRRRESAVVGASQVWW
jgi:hypothetical protein